MRNAEVAEFLENIGDILEIKGETIFKVRAYRDAARTIGSLSEPVEDVAARGELTELPGIGESICGKIIEYLQTGRSEYYDDLRRQISPGLAELLEVPGIGPRKARLFFDALGIDSVDALERAAREHQLSAVRGIGPKTEQNVLNAIERMRGRSGRALLGVALPTAVPVLETIRGFREVVRADLAGSLRRMMETIGDLDLLAASDDPKAVVERFVTLPIAREVLVRGPSKGTIVTPEHLQIDLRVVKPEEYGAALQYFTGSKAHNVRIRTIAEGMGLKVNEYGVFRVSDNERVAGETEDGVYRALGLDWMPPELREDQGEIRAAQEHTLPNLVEVADLRGDLHMHTDWSDGSSTPEEMVRAARSRGYEYVVISDHSVSMAFVHGLTLDRIREQRALIADLGRRYPDIRVLQGIEVNIRADGSLDYDDEVMAQFDVVTASVHGGMQMNRERMTERIIRAMSNPSVDIIGHPTGRLIGRRDPIEVDMQALMRAAARTDTALEVNSQPDRLDLRDADVRLARDHGVMLAIDSDAHSTEQLDLVVYGVATARRGWAGRSDVLNALPVREFLRRVGTEERRQAA